eukprot:CAMPEP_0119549616 /NCGR_PEP_ID=MMETSP1352-20130426/3275_1 /TAXON_ID=265584 /ORGANISM="Stauroneis constricta, Strain CCMP1120" /LENGTH=583 /DNA_ID=CAMNT_0007595211 /DNA_START=31 /DNA_END=1782 /DNA_ORIENTATION=+
MASVEGSGDASSSNGVDFLLTASILAAAATTVVISLLQSDHVSRKFLLNPQRLQLKRRQEYEYYWDKCIKKINLQVDYYLMGGISAYQQSGSASDRPNADPLEKIVNPISGQEEIERFVKEEFVAPSSAETGSRSTMRILKIDSNVYDSGDPRAFVFLLKSSGSSAEVFQLPLTTFATTLQAHFETQITTTAFCFVADASSGAASNLIENLVSNSAPDVKVVSQPTWMVSLASIMLSSAKVDDSKMRQIMFALCRLEAWNAHQEWKISVGSTPKRRIQTVVMTLPGQASTSVLLPVIQSAFPEDRHVFAYDGCVPSVQRALRLSKAERGTDLQTALDSVLTLSNDSTRHCIPLGGNSATPSTQYLSSKIRTLPSALSMLPVQHARVVETWMMSVDAFFALKHNERANGYLPYVFRYDYLSGAECNDFAKGSNPYWSLCSLLQHITGSRSNGLDDLILTKAIRWMQEFHSTDAVACVDPNFPIKTIENCVFQHKSILIGDKTLQDTVLPKQHWTLKQASKKGGCACCGPEPDDEEEEEEQEQKKSRHSGQSTQTKKDATSLPKQPATGYVDGAMSFAFDPARFS